MYIIVKYIYYSVLDVATVVNVDVYSIVLSQKY